MDLAFESVGENGKFQKIIAFLLILVAPLTLLISTTIPFMSSKPVFSCKLKNSLDDFQICRDEDLCKSNLFEYKKIPEFSINNWVYDFDLYCEYSYLPPIIATSFFFGGIFGSIILSSIPDKYGREKLYKILVIINFVLHLNIVFSNNAWHLVIVVILMGISSFAYSMSTFIITEYLDRNSAGVIMSLNNAIFPLSGLLVSIYFIFVNNWRLLFIISSFLSFITVLISQKYFVESPRWLNSKNRFLESLDTLMKIAIINDNEKKFKKFLKENSCKIFYKIYFLIFFKDFINKTSHTLKEMKNSYNIFQIFSFKSQKQTLWILTYIWFICGFCFYGLLLNLEELGGSVILNSFVMFTAEILSELLTGYLADQHGRLIIFKISGFIGGIAFILFELFSDTTIKTILIFITSLGFSGAFNLMFIYSPEIIPTTIRSTTMGFLYSMSILGPILVPSLSKFVPHIPILFGVLSLTGTYFSFKLVETLGRDIEDDMPDIVRQNSFLSFNQKKSHKSFKNNRYKELSNLKLINKDGFFNKLVDEKY